MSPTVESVVYSRLCCLFSVLSHINANMGNKWAHLKKRRLTSVVLCHDSKETKRWKGYLLSAKKTTDTVKKPIHDDIWCYLSQAIEKGIKTFGVFLLISREKVLVIKKSSIIPHHPQSGRRFRSALKWRFWLVTFSKIPKSWVWPSLSPKTRVHSVDLLLSITFHQVTGGKRQSLHYTNAMNSRDSF